MSNRIGWELPGIYDGVSIWVEDGKLINAIPVEWSRRHQRVQEFIDLHEAALELTAETSKVAS